VAKTSDLLPDEKLLLAVNRHPIVMVGRCATAVGGAVVLIVLIALVKLTGTLGDLKWFAVLLIALVAFIYADFQYIRWRAESFSITDQRIITKRGVLSRYSRSIGLSRVQDVTTSQGVFGRMFGYGTVEVDSAGRDGTEVLTYVPDPVGFRNVIYQSAGGPSGLAGQPT
jgi:uncharacterized membrane protein YdbT with pleckstrin-like domain